MVGPHHEGTFGELHYRRTGPLAMLVAPSMSRHLARRRKIKASADGDAGQGMNGFKCVLPTSSQQH